MNRLRDIFIFSKKIKGGFSIFEAALSMAMFAAVITVGLTNYALKRESDQLSQMNRKMSVIKSKIDSFVSNNGYLPCPAKYTLKPDDSDYLMEARDGVTGYCDTSGGVETKDSDSAANYGSTRFSADPAIDFVKGVVPCRTLGLPANCADDKNGNKVSYVVSNIATKATPCYAYLKDDLTTEERPYTLKILNSADPADSFAVNYTNYGQYSAAADEPLYAIIWHGDDGVGAFNNNGGKNTAKEVTAGAYVGDNYFQALNHDSYTGGDIRYSIAPTQPLDTPSANLEANTQKITFGDVVMWGRPSGVALRVCAHCRSCDEEYKNSTTQILSFSSCVASVEPTCECTANSDCDEGAGECCNIGTGRCSMSCSALTVACAAGGCDGGNVPYSGPESVSDCSEVTADISVGTELFNGTTASGRPYSFIYNGVRQDDDECVPEFRMDFDYICQEITTSPAIDGFSDNQQINVYTDAGATNVFGNNYTAPDTTPTLVYSSTSSGVGTIAATAYYKEDGVEKNEVFNSAVTNADTYRGKTYDTSAIAGTYDCPEDTVSYTVACDAGGCTQGGDTISYSGDATVPNCSMVDDYTDVASGTVIYSGTNGDGIDWAVKYMGAVADGSSCYPKLRWYPTNLCDYITQDPTVEDTSSIYIETTDVGSYGQTMSGWGLTLGYSSSGVSYTYAMSSSSSGGSVTVTGADAYRGYTFDLASDIICPQDAAASCSLQSECSGSERCCGGGCTTSTPCACDADNDCQGGEYCCGGECNSTCSCDVRTDCPAPGSQRCCNSSSGGSCVTSTPCSCDADEDCASGEACIGGICDTAGGSCSVEADCGIAECCCSATGACSLTCSTSVGSSGGTDCADTFTAIDDYQGTTYGYAGGDTFTINDSGSSGGVKIYGGNGNDISYFNYVGTYCEENRGTCTQTSKCNVAGTSGSSCDGDDQIYSYGSGTDTIYAGVGNDTIYAGPSSDIAIYGGDGNDTIYGEAGNDDLYGEAGDDYINLGAAGLNAYAGSGNDTVVGGTDGGYCYGHEGNDTISECEEYYPGDGNDTTSNSTSNGLKVCEVIIGSCSKVHCTDSVAGTACTGDDIISTGTGGDTISAGVGSDTIYSLAGNDTIYTDGSGSEDSSATNSIYPGTGTDVMTFANGKDYAYFGRSWGADSIISFSSANDRIYVPDLASTTITTPTTCDGVASSTQLSYSGNTICVRGISAVYGSSGSQNVFQWGGYTISGTIVWEHDDTSPVVGATVTLTGTESTSTTTDSSGNYSLTVYNQGSYTITPTKQINRLNGATAADVTAIQQHSAGTVLITDSYKKICADVNRSNSITVSDSNTLNSCIAGNATACNQISKWWRFVPSSVTLASNPFPFSTESITTTVGASNVTGQDFIGMKIGDVNGTADPAN